MLLLGVVESALAQPSTPHGRGNRRPREGPYRPATLRVWNRPIVVFRTSVLRISPAERAALAARRVESLAEDIRPDEIRAESATVACLTGVVVIARNQILFGLLPADLDPHGDETRESAGHQASSRWRGRRGSLPSWASWSSSTGV